MDKTVILQAFKTPFFIPQPSSLLYSALSQQYNVEDARDRHIVHDSHTRRFNPAICKEHRRATYDCLLSAFLYIFSLIAFKCKNIIYKVQCVKTFQTHAKYLLQIMLKRLPKQYKLKL